MVLSGTVSHSLWKCHVRVLRLLFDFWRARASTPLGSRRLSGARGYAPSGAGLGRWSGEVIWGRGAQSGSSRTSGLFDSRGAEREPATASRVNP
ncbi:hypothetical protein GQ53DRAFT_159399 [Thozetella sp. PMI_491]|nr:hypothetical protein GQ53DRAFT_159399 [Thozetella sp. PMI_491]